jgi:type I restriction-modification system DNA methylase subunit
LDVEAFIARWSGREGGQERANYSLFLSELCDVLGVARPDPANASSETNDYVFERVVKEPGRDGASSSRRIDLYRRNSFVLEAKQSRQEKGGPKEIGQLEMPVGPVEHRGRRGAARSWDVLMMNARVQAENYVRLLPAGHAPPPFVIVCDVGHCLEVYANFRRDGKAFDQFPDRQGFRIYLEDLRKADIRERLKDIWDAPETLDPARNAARVTRAIAERLAKVSQSLERKKHPADEVAMFLMRCLFTMFAEDVGLLPHKAFENTLKACEADPSTFQHDVGQLWQAMDKGDYAHAIRKKVKRFNGEFFKNPVAIPLDSSEIFELRNAASYDWREVEPAIFGTLLEQALDKDERKKLGAHYTPRAYVERLVLATVIDPLRKDWESVLGTVERLRRGKKPEEAIAAVQKFHDELCGLRILDPACGTGNFLYVALELLKRLEGEVLEALANLGGQEALSGLEGHSVDPHQFLGLELNERAVAIAELVLWIGHLQWHYRNHTGDPSEPIMKAFHNIRRQDAVLTPDHSKRPEWPEADFIVGNPPFIGGKDLRARLGDDYAEALWKAHKHMNESADFVMYWWDRAAEILLRKGSKLRRFGLVTTNSISQVFQRRVMEAHLRAAKPISLIMAIPDHPWTKMTPDAAAVRIAMTVCEAGGKDGILREVVREAGLDTDTPIVDLVERAGIINSDLTVGEDLSNTSQLTANHGVSSRGMMLFGSGFIVTPSEAKHLGLGRRTDLDRYIKPYRNGRDLAGRPRNLMVIDLFGLTPDDVRSKFPEVYQHILTAIKPERDINRDKDIKARWWLFGRTRDEIRPAMVGLSRYIATIETAKHRVFQFLDAAICPDNKLLVVANSDAYALGVLSSRVHVTWALRAGGWLGVGNDPVYVKSRCLDPFPFPAATDAQKDAIRAIAEELDAHRKRVLAQHPHLTLTGLYNVLEELRAGAKPDTLEPKARKIFDDGLVLILKELHDRLDAAVFNAYGWPADLSDEEILARLVALNAERAKEEARGLVRWLRPEYQIPKFGSVKEKAELELVGGRTGEGEAKAVGAKPAFPASEVAQTAAVMSALASASASMSAAAIAMQFKQGRRVQPKVAEILNAIARIGFVSTGDKGETFTLRRAA